MNKGIFLLFLSCIVLSNFISASTSLGTFEQGEEIRVSFNCENATYFNLSSISYPNSSIAISNISMGYFVNGEYNLTFNLSNEIGRYSVKVISDGCDKTFNDYFIISSNGEDQTYSYLIASVILILTFLSLGLLIYKDKEKMSDEKYWNSMVNKWMNKNYLRWSAVALWYNIKKNAYVLYYLLGFMIFIIVYDITEVFNLISVLPIFSILLSLYTWGSLLVVMVFFGQAQEWIKEWLEEVQNINWGETFHGK